MERKINFGAGPAELPGEVLYEVSKSILKYKKTGLSIMELPHRSAEFLEIIEESKSLVRELAGIDDRYEVVWMHGGGRMQFCMVPMNFLGDGRTAAYIDTGYWSHEAIEYARHYGETTILASGEQSNYCSLPAWPAKVPPKSAYLHITTNNTICGTQWHNIPSVAVPFIADMSSDIFSAECDYSKFDMFYATAQKNLGIGGLALAVIRKDLLKKTARQLPPLLSYEQQVKQNSIVNTANVAGIYTALLMLRWIKEKGIKTLELENQRKATLLYETIDNSEVFRGSVTEKADRSVMNVCFNCTTPELEKNFLEYCTRNHVIGIEGHRKTGGFRASIYNAVQMDSVVALTDMMKDFESDL